ncbi:hypothetical protein LB553_28275 [Mesorhizobium sp. CA8]|uniref:hypothetical protein n=1 Tax=Mesorhizobium sp. CA8 TaxID=2876637 RepID=UPI001CCBF1E9|nr:hypothetical protein [Mesorhizobium sp. CA8]MBZ9764737.1 hypothetical protein [Mesorhizobium sp. CA8]
MDRVLDIADLLLAHLATVAGGVGILLELLRQHRNADLGIGRQVADILLQPAAQEFLRRVHGAPPRSEITGPWRRGSRNAETARDEWIDG